MNWIKPSPSKPCISPTLRRAIPPKQCWYRCQLMAGYHHQDNALAAATDMQTTVIDQRLPKKIQLSATCSPSSISRPFSRSPRHACGLVLNSAPILTLLVMQVNEAARSLDRDAARPRRTKKSHGIPATPACHPLHQRGHRQ